MTKKATVFTVFPLFNNLLQIITMAQEFSQGYCDSKKTYAKSDIFSCNPKFSAIVAYTWYIGQ